MRPLPCTVAWFLIFCESGSLRVHGAVGAPVANLVLHREDTAVQLLVMLCRLVRIVVIVLLDTHWKALRAADHLAAPFEANGFAAATKCAPLGQECPCLCQLHRRVVTVPDQVYLLHHSLHTSVRWACAYKSSPWLCEVTVKAFSSTGVYFLQVHPVRVPSGGYVHSVTGLQCHSYREVPSLGSACA